MSWLARRRRREEQAEVERVEGPAGGPLAHRQEKPSVVRLEDHRLQREIPLARKGEEFLECRAIELPQPRPASPTRQS